MFSTAEFCSRFTRRMPIVFGCLLISTTINSAAYSQQRQPTTPLAQGQRTGQTQRIGQTQRNGQGRVYGPAKAQQPAPQNRTAQLQTPARQPVQQGQATQRTGPPKEFVLTPQQQNKIDQMLDYWESKTSDIKTLECQFARWVYDPNFGPKNNAKTFTTGEIRYAAVDRGMIHETSVYDYDAKKAKAGAKWPFTERPNAVGEHWVCDGKSVFEFSHKTKELVEIKLPAQMQGAAIADGPLPFMFGAKAQKIKQRYWIREIPRPNDAAPYHLELLPKRMGEDYSRIRIKLNAKNFLPEEMVLYELNQVGRSAYAFRDIKADATMNNLQNFLGGFVRPKTPHGWKKVVRDVGAPQKPQAPPPRQAKSGGKTLK